MAERTVSVKLKADIADYVAKFGAAGAATRNLEKAGRDLRSALDDQEKAAGRVRVAQAELTTLREKGKASVAQLAAAEEKLADSHRGLESAQVRVRESTAAWQKAQADAEKGLGGLDDKLKSSAKNAQFNAMQFGLAFGGLPAAALAAGAGVAAGLAVVPIAAAAYAATVAASNASVRKDFVATGELIVGQAQAWAEPLTGEVDAALLKVQGTIRRVSPEMAQIFANSAPAVGILADTIDGLVERTMPGLVTASANSIPPLVGMRDAAAEVGDGFTMFFTNLSAGADASAGILRTFGGIAQDALGFAGSFLANLANGGGGVLQQFRGDLSQVEGVLLTLSQAGGGAYSAVSGFLSTVSGGLGGVRLLATALNALPSSVTNFAGSLFAVQKMGSLVGVGFESGFGRAKQAMADADINGTSKFKAGLGGFLSGALSPMNLALGLGAFVLDIWGQKMQARAQEVQEYQKGVQDLTQALREDNGAVGANTNAWVQNKLGQAGVYANLQVLGGSYDQVNRAVNGQQDALNAVVGSTKSHVLAMAQQSGASQDVQAKLASLTDQYLSGSISAEEYQSRLVGLNASHDGLSNAAVNVITAEAGMGRSVADTAKQMQQAKAAQQALDEASSTASRNLTSAQYAAQTSAADLQKAWEGLNQAGGDVVAKGQAIIDVLDQLSGRHKSAEEAQQGFNDTVRDLAKNLGKAASDGSRFNASMIQVDGSISTVTESGSNLQNVVEQAATNMSSYGQALKDAGVPSDQIAGKLQTMRDALAGQLKQLGLTPAQIDKVLEHYGAVPKDIATTLHLEGDKTTQAELTSITDAVHAVPDSKGVNVDAITGPAQESLLDLGYTIVQMPDGTFQVFSDTEPGRAAAKQLLKDVDGSKAVTKIDAEMATAYGKFGTFLSTVDGSSAAPHVGADTVPGLNLVGGFLRWVDGSGASPWIFSNTGPAYSGVGGFLGWTNGTNAAPHVGASINGYGEVGAFISWINGQTATVHVSAVGSGIAGLGGRKDGGPVGYKDGGEVPGFAGGGSAWLDVRGGGPIHGPGTGRSDSIIAVSNREFVVKEGPAQDHLALLYAINAGKVPAYADQLLGFAGGGLADAAASPSSTVQQQILSGAAVVQPLSAGTARGTGAAASAGDGGQFVGELYLDSGEFLGAVRGQIKSWARGIKGAVSAGSGGSR